jgi:hypothetical protein
VYVEVTVKVVFKPPYSSATVLTPSAARVPSSGTSVAYGDGSPICTSRLAISAVSSL